MRLSPDLCVCVCVCVCAGGSVPPEHVQSVPALLLWPDSPWRDEPRPFPFVSWPCRGAPLDRFLRIPAVDAAVSYWCTSRALVCGSSATL
jgi:hypothetical protein